MIYKLKSRLRAEEGITGLETAIILVAFVVVAAVFSFAVLSAGTFATQKSEEAVYSGLEGVRSTLQLQGSVVVSSTTAGATEGIDGITFAAALVSGGDPVDVTVRDSSSKNVLVIDYLDSRQRQTDVYWTVNFLGEENGDGLLGEGETAEITVIGVTGAHQADLGLTSALTVSTDFVLEVKPPTGGVMRIERRTPDYIQLYNIVD